MITPIFYTKIDYIAVWDIQHHWDWDNMKNVEHFFVDGFPNRVLVNQNFQAAIHITEQISYRRN